MIRVDIDACLMRTKFALQPTGMTKTNGNVGNDFHTGSLSSVIMNVNYIIEDEVMVYYSQFIVRTCEI